MEQKNLNALLSRIRKVVDMWVTLPVQNSCITFLTKSEAVFLRLVCYIKHNIQLLGKSVQANEEFKKLHNEVHK